MLPPDAAPPYQLAAGGGLVQKHGRDFLFYVFDASKGYRRKGETDVVQSFLEAKRDAALTKDERDFLQDMLDKLVEHVGTRILEPQTWKVGRLRWLFTQGKGEGVEVF